MRNNNVRYITQTAVMLALLIVVQLLTRSFGQFITGSLVNLILLVSVFMIGIYGGLTIAILSPILAFMAGIGPAFIQIIPFVAVGNALLVTIAWLIAGKRIRCASTRDFTASVTGLLAASACKFLFLWIGLVMVALPMIPGIKEKQIVAISAAFSWPQLVTALIGSALTLIIVPQLKKALKKK